MSRAAELPAGLLADVLAHAAAGIALLDAEGRFVMVNAALCDQLGHSKEEMLLLTVRSVTDPEEASTDAPLWKELFERRRTHYTADRRCLHKNGSVVWTRMSLTLLSRPEGDFAVAVVEDITAKRSIERAAEEVRRAHERYALVARATNDVIWDWDAEHGTIIWNDALRTMFGYEPDQIDNRLAWWDSHLHPEDRERVVSGINRIIEEGGSSWTDEYRFERADGTFTEVLDRGYIARSEDGTPIRMIGAMLDVTERKHAERIATFMAEASAVLASSLDYHVTLPAIARLSVPLLADWCFIDLRTGDQSYERVATAHRSSQRDETDEQQPRFADDLLREVILTGKAKLLENLRAAGEVEQLRSLGIRSALIVPLVVADGGAVGALTLAMSDSRRALDERDLPVVQDMARRAAMAIEHARLYAEAQQASLAKDEFLAMLSHELSTPLTIILGWSALLSRPGVDVEDLRRGIETIRSSALAQAHLIDDALDLSRVTTGKLRLDMQPVPIGDLVSDSMTAVRVAATAKRIELVAPDSTAGTVLGDAKRLRQVIWNLLTNAIKFTEPGGKVTVELESTPGSIRLTITDTGQGIEADFLAHVFEPFRQGDSSITRSHGGLGLGLAIVRYIVEAHGGRVGAFSEGPGHGARFVVELPALAEAALAADVSHPAPAQHTMEIRRERGALNGVRVLFVDDQPETRELAHRIFSRAGADAIIASSAAEAIEAFERRRPDIIVADIAMPEVDGYALIAEIRRRDAIAGNHTPAIAATAYRTPEDRQRALSSGFDAYVKKPIDPDMLTSIAATLTTAGSR